MTERTKPPFRADHVGSLIRPQELVDARAKKANGEMSEAELKRIQEAAIRDVVKMQEDLGLHSVTDGEFNRQSWQTDFVMRFDNVKSGQARLSVQFHNEQGSTEGKPAVVQVAGKLNRPKPIFVDDFKFLKSVTRETPKITIPSPSVMHFRGGRDAIDDKAYPDMADFYKDLARVYNEEIMDLAGAGCRYLQLDEVNFAYLCDPKLREQVKTGVGEDPAQLPHTYARLINNAIKGRPADMTVCMHLCRGNFRGNWVAEGGYDPVAEVLFNEVGVDGYFLEYDSARAGGFEPLRFVPKNKTVVLGLVTTKKGEIEKKDDLKRRIDQASKFVPLEQLCLSPQCGFSSGVGGNTMDIDHEKAKLALVVETAREVWGSA
ncbi:MAG: 5-methyltetrahydropteroyltriglutamate--homocysteine S-methyltransferase [Alphaproteobacteria bacterium]